MGAGLTSVKIKGLNNGTIDLSSYAWTYKVLLLSHYHPKMDVYYPLSLKCCSIFYTPLMVVLTMEIYIITLSQIGVQGEDLRIYQGDGLNNVNWTSTSEPPKMQPLTWYKVMNNLYCFCHH